jgi:spermidine/putrescine ABC transporter ATP-binding subunit
MPSQHAVSHEGEGAQVELVALSRRYAQAFAVHDLHLAIAAGELLTLLGPSGSGKTTTLMMIAGFVRPSAGDIRIGRQSVIGLPAYMRNIGVVFQNYALFPHMDVFDNVAFPLRMRHVPLLERRQRVREALELVHLSQMEKRKIHHLSGGEQQRVALARALVFRPPVLLMDEPLGALDRKLKEELQNEIKRVQQVTGVTVLYVTHDQEEALILSDRIAIMDQGKLHQVGTPRDVYERPGSTFVARFMGESNSLVGEVVAKSGSMATIGLAFDGIRIECQTAAALAGRAAMVVIRPEALELRPASARERQPNSVDGFILDTVYLGQSIRYGVGIGDAQLIARVSHRAGERIFEPGSALSVLFPKQAAAFPIEPN